MSISLSFKARYLNVAPIKERRPIMLMSLIIMGNKHMWGPRL